MPYARASHSTLILRGVVRSTTNPSAQGLIQHSSCYRLYSVVQQGPCVLDLTPATARLGCRRCGADSPVPMVAWETTGTAVPGMRPTAAGALCQATAVAGFPSENAQYPCPKGRHGG